jgi:hypothetical protein
VRKKSRKMDFSKEDAVDDLLLNEVIWRSVARTGFRDARPPPRGIRFSPSAEKG